MVLSLGLLFNFQVIKLKFGVWWGSIEMTCVLLSRHLEGHDVHLTLL
jgi:hypothetical protein